MAEEHVPKPLLWWLALGQYDPRGRVALAGGLIKGQQSGSDQPLSYGDPWLDGSQQLSSLGDLGHLIFYLSPSLNLPLYYDFETQGEKPIVWVFDLTLIDFYRWMTPRGSGGLFIHRLSGLMLRTKGIIWSSRWWPILLRRWSLATITSSLKTTRWSMLVLIIKAWTIPIYWGQEVVSWVGTSQIHHKEMDKVPNQYPPSIPVYSEFSKPIFL